MIIMLNILLVFLIYVLEAVLPYLILASAALVVVIESFYYLARKWSLRRAKSRGQHPPPIALTPSNGSKFLSTVCLVCCCLQLMLYAYNFYRYSQAIPDHIEVNWLVDAEIDGFREYDGGAIFSLKASTLEKIREHGIAYLNQDLQSRRAKKKHLKPPTYAAWRQEDCMIDTMPLGTIVGKDTSLYEKIISGSVEEGAFCSRTPDAVDLTIIPDLEIIVWTFVD